MEQSKLENIVSILANLRGIFWLAMSMMIFLHDFLIYILVPIRNCIVKIGRIIDMFEKLLK